MATVNFEVDDKLYEQSKESAQKLGITFTTLVRLLLQSHLQQIEFKVRPEENHAAQSAAAK